MNTKCATVKNRLRARDGMTLTEVLVALAILDADELLQSCGDCWRLDGIYACTEMIGREQGEQIGDFHGKTD
mgnify:CR=1 FL=1